MMLKVMVVDVLLINLSIGAIFGILIDFDSLIMIVFFLSIPNGLGFDGLLESLSPPTHRPLFSILFGTLHVIDSPFASLHRY